VIHGGDGPHAVIATALFERIDQDQKKILAFADSRQEAAYFAWYLDDTYQSVLRRNVLYRTLVAKWSNESEPLSLADLADGYRRRCALENLIDEAATLGEQRRRAWLDVYREFLTEETRLSLAGVGLIRWSIRWPPSFKPPEVLLTEPWSLDQDDALVLTFLLLDHLRRDRAVELDTREETDLDWPSLDLFGSHRFVRLGPPRRQSDVVSWNGPKGWRVQFLAKITERKGYVREQALDIAETTLRSIWDHLVRFSDTQALNSRLLTRVSDGRRLMPVWWRVTPIPEGEQIYQCDRCNRMEAVSFQHICPRRGCDGRLFSVANSVMADNHYRTLYQGDLRQRLVVEEHTAQLTTERGREVQRDFQEGRIHVLSCSTTFELGVDLGDLNTVFLRNVPPEPFNYVQRVGRAGRRAGSPGFAVTYCRRGPHDLYHFADPARLLSGRTKAPSISLQNERIAERHLAAVVLSEFFRHEPARFNKVRDLLQDWSTPAFASAVRTFLGNFREWLEQDFRAIFPPQLTGPLGIDNGSWAGRLSGDESRLSLAEVEVASDFRRANDLEIRSRNAGQYQQAGWAQRRKTTIAEEDVLSFLSRKAVIPKYGFPVDVVELDTQRTGTRQGYDVTLARDLMIAIGEFAPTATLVAGKREWQSYGLKKVPEKEWERKKYKVCHRHNLMVTWNEGESAPPLPCGDPAQERSYVIPKFGFVTSTKPPKPPARRPTRLFTTRPYFLRSTGVERGEIRVDGTNGPLATIRKAIPGRMAVLSEGRRAGQFYICNRCGAGFVESLAGASHKTPWNSECLGTLARLSLGHEFVTDVVQVEFYLPPPPEAVEGDYSGLGLGIATALLEGMAEVVDVPSADLSVTIGRGGSVGLPVIVLYDAVPGGAGLVAHIEDADVFRMTLEAAYRRVEGGCECGEDTSCYGCLRSYRNQFAHTHLKRGPVKQYLSRILAEWKLT
jgi:Helicase conserved C-terminal domain/MrfA Zn-binding domain